MNLPLQIPNKKKYLEERKSIYLEKNQFHYFLLVTALLKNRQTIMVTAFLSKKAVDKKSRPVKKYILWTTTTKKNNERIMKELKGYYTKESHWLLTFLLSQKIDFITFFLSKTLIKKFVKP